MRVKKELIINIVNIEEERKDRAKPSLLNRLTRTRKSQRCNQNTLTLFDSKLLGKNWP